MGYFDDMKVMLGRGMNAADRKTQELRLQAELSRISSNLESAYAALGKVLYSHPTIAEQVQRECPGEFNAVTSLLQENQSVRAKIGDLQRQVVAPVPRPTRQFLCTNCGASVTLDSAYCPSCGDNLSELKAQYRLCPNCKTYHTYDSMFCMQCGSQTVEIPVAQKIQGAALEETAQSDGTTTVDSFSLGEPQQPVQPALEDFAETVVPPDEEQAQVTSSPTCPNCGALIAKDFLFCGECGARIV